jgi:hypothetical protein
MSIRRGLNSKPPDSICVKAAADGAEVACIIPIAFAGT